MRAMAVFPAQRELRIIDVPAPELRNEHQVAIRIREVGICGTDREICEFHYGSPPAGTDRLVLGHEVLGEVVGVGPAVRTVARGDLVVITVRRPCDDPECVACRAGRQDFCTTGHFRERGIKGADGFMTELVIEDERYVVRVPKALSEVAVLLEPLSVAAKAAVDLDAILRRYPWEPTALRALVLGAGPIGLLAAMALRARDTETFVYSLEPADSDRGDLVRSLGATYVSARDVPVGEIASRVGAPDIVFEAVGVAKVAFEAIGELARNGISILSGVPGPGGPVEIDLNSIMRNIVLKNQVVFGTVNASRSAFEESVAYLERFMVLFPDSVRRLITQRSKLDDAPALLQRGGGIKHVIQLSS
ncbi:Glucose 1-dehydrogenase [Labilithrix luteola]|uniref:Glucose 1-dehydrogenase n=1 Tax=Labilithrix luteola TaxID=1391654 RepID=A0A0K1Q347_9BACT|nr:glucose 1-dehydrogenase [Labilithrix luteola]AKV00241.1 Glucose 1-dehydrogenase [Labilithrix luteola]